MKILLLFIFIPICEIIVFINVSQFIGIFLTVLIIVITAIIGYLIIRHNGILGLKELKTTLKQNALNAISHGILNLLSGLLLIFPGFITDIAGILLLIPQTRSYIIDKIVQRLTATSYNTANNLNGDIIIEGEYEDIDETDKTNMSKIEK